LGGGSSRGGLGVAAREAGQPCQGAENAFHRSKDGCSERLWLMPVLLQYSNKSAFVSENQLAGIIYKKIMVRLILLCRLCVNRKSSFFLLFPTPHESHQSWPGCPRQRY
jgi:hypothetical protein